MWRAMNFSDTQLSPKPQGGLGDTSKGTKTPTAYNTNPQTSTCVLCGQEKYTSECICEINF